MDVDTLAARGYAHRDFAEIEARDRAQLHERFPGLVERSWALRMERSAPSFFDELWEGPAKNRRGEVLLLLRTPAEECWLHTKRFYPAGGYRLLTGGIRRQETALEALARESMEETGRVMQPADCLGVLRYRLERFSRVFPFITYLFVCSAADTLPHPQDMGEGIAGFRLVGLEELPAVAYTLAHLPAPWQDWGAFRAIGHRFAAQRLGILPSDQ